MGITQSRYHITSENISGRGRQTVAWLATKDSNIKTFDEKSFLSIKTLGKGKFGTVILAKILDSTEYVAIKYIPKQFIFDNLCADKVQQEVEILRLVYHPFIVYYFGGFQTELCICLVLEYASGGELYNRMKIMHKMSEEYAKFYFIELVTVLRYLHEDQFIVYRDLKPENVLLDHLGHIKLCDFGFAYKLNRYVHHIPQKDVCGTAMYISPELASGKVGATHSYPVDWWALGCILYEMVIGSPPFGDTEKLSKFEVFNNINSKTVTFPLSVSSQFKGLVNGMLRKDPLTRFKWKDIMGSPWVDEVNWQTVEARAVVPPWRPPITSTINTSNFLNWNSEFMPAIQSPNRQVDLYCEALAEPSFLSRQFSPSPSPSPLVIPGPAAIDMSRTYPGSYLSQGGDRLTGKQPVKDRHVVAAVTAHSHSSQSPRTNRNTTTAISTATNTTSTLVNTSEFPGRPCGGVYRESSRSKISGSGCGGRSGVSVSGSVSGVYDLPGRVTVNCDVKVKYGRCDGSHRK